MPSQPYTTSPSTVAMLTTNDPAKAMRLSGNQSVTQAKRDMQHRCDRGLVPAALSAPFHVALNDGDCIVGVLVNIADRQEVRFILTGDDTAQTYETFK